MTSIYTLNLTALLALNGALFYSRQSQSQPQAQAQPSSTPSQKDLTTPLEPKYVPSRIQSLLTSPLTPFLTVYTLVMASDWLQGPYLYSLYADEHSLPPSLIPSLFTTGFLSGALSGSFIGSLADTYGRKTACLSFCVVYALSCLFTTLSSSIPVLFIGRVLGGVGTSLLFTVFESFLVSDFKNRGLEGRLGETFGTMSTLNSLVAIASGVGSEGLVSVCGTRRAPFWVAAGVLGLAGGVISYTWKENYAQPLTTTKDNKKDDNLKASTSLLKTLLNPTILALGLSTTIFEGSMYLFVFFWAPALQSSSRAGTSLPYGVIFAAFMASTLASSLLFARITSKLSFSSLLLALLGVSSGCFFLVASLSSRNGSSQLTFWIFCLFEACVGVYFPTMGYLKGKLIEDGVRSQVYGFLRIPLNVFVVVALLVTGRMESEKAFVGVFRVCSVLLLVAAGGFWGVVRRGGSVDV
ncbi:hypothetical protein B0T21DRAFT_409157 [Apiosordaria backusii]|uniref:Molybdate-anion transporter n=1 Tax=Apiosordaria backusii TaxID=314023 RepID=A0AA40K1H0_9PEZI|nr:hypothetical protein B0T21DRAFT_409157 [Apiosordaria backusii]